MKEKKSSLWNGAFISIIGMSLRKMPYPIVAIVSIVAITMFLYYIIKLYRDIGNKNKYTWFYFGMLISALMVYFFMFLNRTIEEFNIWISMKNISGFCAVFFIVLMIIMLFSAAAPNIKTLGGFANAMESQQPGSWFMMKVCFWVVIIGIVGFLSIVAWEHFFE